MKYLSRIITPIAALILLSSCGHTTSDRAISGAAIGAGAGAVGGAVTGGSPLGGAVVGGAAGAAAGALTKPKDLNLGKPIWKQ
jgi:osmotically inducible lipoprotein OsmB